jgi:uncharacterized YccA/Bax inhibitor family protein
MQPPYGYPMIRHTNGLAIVSLVMIFVFPPLAIVFGFVARSQIHRTGEDGDGMAIAGIAVGIAFTLIWIVLLIFMMIAFVAAIHNAPYEPLTTPT